MFAPNILAQSDPELWNAIRLENQRQEDHVELIASENYVSRQVLIAQGSQLTNKYAEGYPGKRYYGGCEYVDMAESIAIERAKQLFGAPWANVQPHSGSQANQAVYTAVLKPGETLLGMSLAHGGHLTHGSPVNLSGKLYRVVSYGLNEDEEIDYDAAERIAMAEKPKLIVTGASAYALAIDWKRFRAIADKCGALLMADIAHYAGLIATGLYPSPIGIADFVTTTTHKTLRGPRGGMIFGLAEQERAINSSIFPGLQGGPLMHVIAAKAVALGEALKPEFKNYQQRVLENARAMAKVLTERGVRVVSGRTDCHLFLVDLRAKHITGKDAEAALGRAHITVNKNAIPNDPQKPAVTSGIRIGSPAMTTRGFRRVEAEELAHLIADVLDNPHENANLERVAGEVKALCARFPVYA
ncbi:MAG: serine hydroxymethyltransferase [Betaproteobacteria bacterium]|nr:MAG: serine hydroxymethyltransferase [Betaproteobacteria bacterium]